MITYTTIQLISQEFCSHSQVKIFTFSAKAHQNLNSFILQITSPAVVFEIIFYLRFIFDKNI